MTHDLPAELSSIPMLQALAILALVSLPVPPQGTEAVTEVGPFGGSYSLVTASLRSPVIALAVEDGDKVLRTDDGGMTYGAPVLDLGSEGGVVGLGFDSGGIAYVMTSSMIRASGDGGATWSTRMLPTITSPITAFAVGSLSVGDLWAAESDGAIHRSTDGGMNWTQTGAVPTGIARSIDLDPTDAERIGLSLGQSAFVSEDAGATFTSLAGIESLFFPGLRYSDIDLLGDRILVSVVEPGFNSPVPYLVASEDGGLTWAVRQSGGISTAQWSIRTDPCATSTVYLVYPGTSTRVSQDGGMTWDLRPTASGHQILDVAFPSLPSEFLHVITRNHIGRATVSSLMIEAAPGGPEPLEVGLIAIDPGNEAHLAIMTGGTLYETLDGGSSWRILPRPAFTGFRKDLEIDSTGNILFASGGLYLWNGTDWAELLSVPVSGSVTAVAPSRVQAGTLYAAIDGAMEDAIAVSYDHGQTWSERAICITSIPNFRCDVTETVDLAVVERAGTPTRVILLREENSNGTLIYTDDLGLFIRVVPGAESFVTALVQSPREPWRVGASFNGVFHVSNDAFDSSTAATAGVGTGEALLGTEASGFLLRAGGGNFQSPGMYQESFDGGQTLVNVAELEAFDGRANDSALATSEARYLVAGQFGLLRRSLSPLVSSPGCEQLNLNGAGRRATLRLFGATSIGAAQLRVDAQGLPANVTCLPLASMSAGLTPNPAGSRGDLCLGGEVGRFNNAIQSSGPGGVVSIDLDPAALPQPAGAVSAMAGAEWHFQCWHRDTFMGAQTSHFSSSASVIWTQ